MKKILNINCALSFMALIMVDTEASEPWAMALLVGWFLVSVLLVKGLPLLRHR